MSQLNINNYNYEPEVDERLLLEIKSGNNAALEQLINKYKNFVRSKAKTYFLVGADKEDIVQEGMIGLFKAIRDFKDDKMVSFKSFAEICVTRQIITAIKTATRQKHMPLNSYISLNKPVYEDDGERFAYFQKAVLEMLNQLNYFPDIMHCHDWHTGMIACMCKHV